MVRNIDPLITKNNFMINSISSILLFIIFVPALVISGVDKIIPDQFHFLFILGSGISYILAIISVYQLIKTGGERSKVKTTLLLSVILIIISMSILIIQSIYFILIF
jgi:hypothetical protein